MSLTVVGLLGLILSTLGLLSGIWSIYLRNQASKLVEKSKEMKLEEFYYSKISPQACGQLIRYFNGDTKKIKRWFKTKNPGLGDVSPFILLMHDHSKKVNQFINNMTKGELA